MNCIINNLMCVFLKTKILAAKNRRSAQVQDKLPALQPRRLAEQPQ